MSFFAKLFRTDPASKCARAEKLLQRGEYNEARWEVEGVEGEAAAVLRAQALGGLQQLNLDEARARIMGGDRQGGEDLLALAQEFGASAHAAQAVRAEARAELDRERAEAAEKAAREAVIVPEGDDPLWSLPPDDPRLRYAVLLESWPEALRERLIKLGGAYAQAVMLLEEGQPQPALAALLPYVDREPAAGWDAARAALQLGQLEIAAAQLQKMREGIGHQRIGNNETAVLEAQVLARIGRGDQALGLIDGELKKGEAISLRGARASVLEALDRPAEAEREVSALIERAPKDQGLYRLLARAREAQGNRVGAATALEVSLAHTCSSPGKCGNQAFDVAAGRMLARLYLEDRAEPARVTELLEQIGESTQGSDWEDHYLTALIARNNRSAELPTMARQLEGALHRTDPRRGWVRSRLLAEVAPG